MNLFSNEKTNLIPKDGTLNYYGSIFSVVDATNYFDALLNTIDWKNDEIILFGKKIVTKRKVAWYGDSGIEYTYSNTTKKALIWTKELREIKLLIEEQIGSTFNSCLLNLYHSGEEGMGWHSDDEKELEKNGTIASVSFGAERKFSFKHKKDQTTFSILLENGSLLVMKDEIQSFWQHKLTPTKMVKSARINLTFRSIVTNQ
jgi:alkylated DNA repair dioxygenase AlkB